MCISLVKFPFFLYFLSVTGFIILVNKDYQWLNCQIIMINNLNRMITRTGYRCCTQLYIPICTYMLLLTMSNFTQEINTSIEFSFEFLHAFDQIALGRLKPKWTWQHLTTSKLLVLNHLTNNRFITSNAILSIIRSFVHSALLLAGLLLKTCE